MQSTSYKISPYLVWPLVFIGQLLATSLLAWHLLAQVSFAYPLGYKLLELNKHIAEYAPLNRHIHGFQFTRPKDHWNLFAQITHGVQNNGEGLTEIYFVLPNDTRIPLMHEAEIIHLQDVSHLINKFYIAGIAGVILWGLFLWIAYRQKLRFPSPRNILLGFFTGIFLLSTLILSIGATRVFYWLHTKVFPEGHQWFFYYEDSLMTTLMKAPDIFAFIAALLLLTLILCWGLTTLGMMRLLKHPITNTTVEEIKPRHLHKKAKKDKKTN